MSWNSYYCFFDFVIIILLIILAQAGTETAHPKGAPFPAWNFTHACKQFSDWWATHITLSCGRADVQGSAVLERTTGWVLLESSKGIDGERWSPRLAVPSVGKQRDIGPRWFQWQKDAGWVRHCWVRKAVDALTLGPSTGSRYFTCGAKCWRGSCLNWLEMCQLGNLYPRSHGPDQVHYLGA